MWCLMFPFSFGNVRTAWSTRLWHPSAWRTNWQLNQLSCHRKAGRPTDTRPPASGTGSAADARDTGRPWRVPWSCDPRSCPRKTGELSWPWIKIYQNYWGTQKKLGWFNGSVQKLRIWPSNGSWWLIDWSPWSLGLHRWPTPRDSTACGHPASPGSPLQYLGDVNMGDWGEYGGDVGCGYNRIQLEPIWCIKSQIPQSFPYSKIDPFFVQFLPPSLLRRPGKEAPRSQFYPSVPWPCIVWWFSYLSPYPHHFPCVFG